MRTIPAIAKSTMPVRTAAIGMTSRGKYTFFTRF